MYLLAVICIVLFYSWFVKEFTDITLNTLFRVDLPIILVGAVIGWLLSPYL